MTFSSSFGNVAAIGLSGISSVASTQTTNFPLETALFDAVAVKSVRSNIATYAMPVAQIIKGDETTGYTTLEAAITAAQLGDTI